MPNRSRRAQSEVLPVITLEVELSDAGLRLLSEKLTAFVLDHDLAETVASRLVSVASEVGDVVVGALDPSHGGHLQADADIGWDDAQLVLIATDHRLPDMYASLRPRLDRIGSRCEAFATQLSPAAELQVWARFGLGP